MQKPSWSNRILLILPVVVALTVMVLASSSPFRDWFRGWALADNREVLAKAEGDLTGQGDVVSVVKVKIRGDLVIEVYSLDPRTQATALRARIILPERNDGYFEFHGQPTNLALSDLNGDGILEILASGFDENLIPRLHVYRYDPAAQVFQLAGPDFLPMSPDKSGP